MDDICIHEERSLSKGAVLFGKVICPGHQWKFDPRTGEPEDQDGCQPTYAVQVTEEGAILVAPEPVTPRKATSNESSTHPAGAEASEHHASGLVVVGAGHVAASPPARCAGAASTVPSSSSVTSRPALPAPAAVQGVPQQAGTTACWLLDPSLVRGAGRQGAHRAARWSGSPPTPARCCSPTAARSPPTSSCSPPAAGRAGCPASRATGSTTSAPWPTATGCASGCRPDAGSASSAAASSAPRWRPRRSAGAPRSSSSTATRSCWPACWAPTSAPPSPPLHARRGVDLRLGSPISEIRPGADGVTVVTADGTETVDDLVVCIGIEPNNDVAVRSGLVVGNGVEVDAQGRTSVPTVFAAGDVAAHDHPLYGRVRVEHFDDASGRPRPSRPRSRPSVDRRRPALVLVRPVRRQRAGPGHDRRPAADTVVTRGDLAGLSGRCSGCATAAGRRCLRSSAGEDLSVARELMDLEIPVTAEPAGRRVGRPGRASRAGRGAGLMAARTVRNFIDGDWVGVGHRPDLRAAQPGRHPRGGQHLPRVRRQGRRRRRLRGRRRAGRSGPTPAREQRAGVLESAAAVLEQQRDSLVEELVREEGKTRAEATMEVSPHAAEPAVLRGRGAAHDRRDAPHR